MGLDGIGLQVNAKNRAAYEMYQKCGFTEKSINMEFLRWPTATDISRADWSNKGIVDACMYSLLKSEWEGNR